jgi:hypothetical protein
MTRIDYAIAHASWSPGRTASLDRLVMQCPKTPMIVESTVVEHANVWAKRLWTYCATGPQPDAWVMLNDDVDLHPDFRRVVTELVELLPGEVISLHCNMPGLVDAAKVSRLAKCYWVSGPAYVLPASIIPSLLSWLDTLPPDWFAGDVNEDGVLASWLWSRQTPAYATIPALVRHDTKVPSTLGYDGHAGRKAAVDWDAVESPKGEGLVWRPDDVYSAPFIEVPWMPSAAFSSLGSALAGKVPLCGFCRNAGAYVVNERRKTGVCPQCAVAIEKTVQGERSRHR